MGAGVEVFVLGNSLLGGVTQDVFCCVFEAFANNEDKVITKLNKSASNIQMSVGLPYIMLGCDLS